MKGIINRQIINVLQSFSLGFLKDKQWCDEMGRLLSKKISMISDTGIGKDIGITRGMRQDKIPFTDYSLYEKYYNNPNSSDFMFPLNDYVNVTTSGTMSKPKKYLFPRKALSDNMRKTLLAKLLLYTHDGERVTLEVGDTIYANLPGGSQISNHYVDIGGRQSSFFVKRCPDPNLPFDEKVNYFVEHHKEIDVAYMTIPTLFDDVYPRIGEPLNLKGFVVQDSAAAVLKDKIKKITGSYPKVAYGSTEALACSVASIEHPGGFIFDWRVVYPEFIPVKSLDDVEARENVETVRLPDVEVGERYSFVISPYLTEIHRYLMPDIFECKSLGDDILSTDLPVFKYYSRGDRLISLHNFTRISEEELLLVMQNAAVPYVDFTARRETEGYRDYMKIYVELREPMPVEEVHRKISGALLGFDKDWRDLTDYLKYDPLRIGLLPRGSFKRYFARKEGMYRVDRVEMREERLNLLLSK